MAAILDFRLPVTSYSILIDAIGFPVPENIGVAFGILFLCATDAEIRLVEYVGKLRLKIFRFPEIDPSGKKIISQEPSKIFRVCLRYNVRSCVGEEQLKARK